LFDCRRGGRGGARLPRTFRHLLIDRKGEIVLRQGTIDPAFKSAVEETDPAGRPGSQAVTAPVRVGILFGGSSVEHEVSVVSRRGVAGALDTQRFTPVPLESPGREVASAGSLPLGCCPPARSASTTTAGSRRARPRRRRLVVSRRGPTPAAR
jgi:hypothetical protein